MEYKDQPDYSVVIPVYNSVDSLPIISKELIDLFNSISATFEIIFIDDFSTDGSRQSLIELAKKKEANIKSILLQKNFGQHNATICGLGFAQGKWIITMDDDLQHPTKEVIKLITSQKESDSEIVYGIFTKKKRHSLIRNIGSKVIKHSSRLLRKTPGEGSSFRLMTNRLAKELSKHRLSFLFIEEIVTWYTHNISFVEVEHHPRRFKQSNYSGLSLIKLVSNLVIYYTGAPLKMMVYTGFTISFISLIMGLVYIVKKIFFNVPLGYTSLITAILFSTSLILLSLGIIGEYLSRIYMAQNQRPPWVVDRIYQSEETKNQD